MAELFADGGDVLHAWVVVGGHEEAEIVGF